jgi:HEAT repeat protein
MDQSSLHDKIYNVDSEERMKAVKLLGALFESFPDRKLAFEDLLRLCSDEDSTIREEAIISLTTVFPNVPDRELAWERFLNLTAYPSEQVIEAAVKAITTVFPLMPDKNRAWKDIFGLIISKYSFEDISLGVSRSLSYIIPQVPDKQQVWTDLLEMIFSKEGTLQKKAASLLITVFPELEENKKEEAWKDLIRFAASDNSDVQKEIFLALPLAFASAQNRSSACNDILKLTQHENRNVKRQALDTLITVFPQILETTEKATAWKDFFRLMSTEEDYVKDTAAYPLVMVLPEQKDKERVWKALIGLTEDEDEYIQKKAADGLIDVLVKAYQDVPDKKKALRDLICLTEKKDSYVLRKSVKVLTEEEKGKGKEKEEKTDREEKNKLRRLYELTNEGLTDEKQLFVQRVAANSLSDERKKQDFDLYRLEVGRASSADSHVKKGIVKSFATTPELQDNTAPKLQDKKEIVAELLHLNSDPDPLVRRGAIETLLAEEKSWAFFDLVRLASGQDAQFRKKATELLLKAFPCAEGKQEAWTELVRLTSSEDREVRKGAITSLSEAYFQVPDKDRAWGDLIRLSRHNDSFVQRVSARTLAPAFFHLRDKTSAWKDLQVLANAPYTYVRKYALRALARACLWRSLKAENEGTYIFGLREAVGYFKEAAEVHTKANISEFYLPFYEALLYIIASDTPERKAGIEVERYLSKVTKEIQDSEESQELFGITTHLADLLQEAGKLNPKDLYAKKALLETCILTFDQALELFDDVEERAIIEKKSKGKEYSGPGKVLMEKKMKETISGIRYRARVTCLKSKGSPGQSLACTLSQKVRKWKFEELDKDGKKLDRQLEALLNLIKSKIPYVPENMYIFEKIEDIRQEGDMLERYRKVPKLLSLIPEARMLAKR